MFGYELLLKLFEKNTINNYLSSHCKCNTVAFMNIKRCFLIPLLLLSTGSVFSQASLGTLTPDTSAIFQVATTSNKGFLLPRMTTLQRDLIINPANGLVLYNTSVGEIQSNSGSTLNPKWSGSNGAIGFEGPIGPTGDRGESTIISRTISGTGNAAVGVNATVGGGTGNSAIGVTATVGGGTTNQAIGANSSVGGGSHNVSVAVCTSVFGGAYNDTNGTNSSVGGGIYNSPVGNNSVVVGGSYNSVSSVSIDGCVAGGSSNQVLLVCIDCNIAGGTYNVTNELNCTVSGGSKNLANGISAAISGGTSNTAKSYGEWVGGLFSTAYSPTSAIGVVVTDRLFTIGNGTAIETRSDALTVLKSGVGILPSITNALLASGNEKTILTKEYGDATYSKFNTEPPASASAIGKLGEIRVTQTHIYTCIATNTWVKTTATAGSW